MNDIMNNEVEINGLRNELNKLAADIEGVKAEKARIMTWLDFYQRRVECANNEIADRMENPERYPLAAGAGTIEHLQKDIQSFMAEISRIENEIADFDQPIEDLEESRHQTLIALADKIGLEDLKKQRTAIGKEMAKHSRLQHEAYKTQKERYENCKNTFGFTPDDRKFIEYHKSLNAQHMDEWIRLCDKRHEICELIDALDPSDEDLGLDEDEDA